MYTTIIPATHSCGITAAGREKESRVVKKADRKSGPSWPRNGNSRWLVRFFILFCLLGRFFVVSRAARAQALVDKSAPDRTVLYYLYIPDMPIRPTPTRSFFLHEEFLTSYMYLAQCVRIYSYFLQIYRWVYPGHALMLIFFSNIRCWLLIFLQTAEREQTCPSTAIHYTFFRWLAEERTDKQYFRSPTERRSSSLIYEYQKSLRREKK